MTLTNENDEDRQNIILNRSASTLSSEAQISSSRYYHQNQTVGWPNNNILLPNTNNNTFRPNLSQFVILNNEMLTQI